MVLNEDESLILDRWEKAFQFSRNLHLPLHTDAVSSERVRAYEEIMRIPIVALCDRIGITLNNLPFSLTFRSSSLPCLG
jgi:hypothetical protein